MSVVEHISPYPGLPAGVLQDGHGVGVSQGMAHQGGAKHPGQIAHIHLGLRTLGHSGSKKLHETKTRRISLTDLIYRVNPAAAFRCI